MSKEDETGAAEAEGGAEVPEAGERDFTDPRAPSQVEAEAGARDGAEDPDPALRAADAASARAYAKDGILGAPGSEVPGKPGKPSQPEGVRPASQAEAEADVRPVPAGADPAGGEPPAEKDGAS